MLAELKANLQTAIEIELATIPIYLYTYYSLIRNTESGETMSDAQLFANKAGGLIMSVAVEEMLHMSLSSNVLYAMGGGAAALRQGAAALSDRPALSQAEGAAWARRLRPPVLIPLGGFGFEQLWHFLQIEYPEQWDALPQDRNWQTIGQFYSYIRCLLSTKFLTDADFRKGGGGQGDPALQLLAEQHRHRLSQGRFRSVEAGAAGADARLGEAGKHRAAPRPRCSPTPRTAMSARPSSSPSSRIRDAASAIDTICDQGEGCHPRCRQ